MERRCAKREKSMQYLFKVMWRWKLCHCWIVFIVVDVLLFFCVSLRWLWCDGFFQTSFASVFVFGQFDGFELRRFLHKFCWCDRKFIKIDHAVGDSGFRFRNGIGGLRSRGFYFGMVDGKASDSGWSTCLSLRSSLINLPTSTGGLKSKIDGVISKKLIG